MRRYVVCSSLFYFIFACLLCLNEAQQTYRTDCSNLRMGQYICPDPDYNFIDPATQQPRGCTKENKAKGEHHLPYHLIAMTYLNYYRLLLGQNLYIFNMDWIKNILVQVMRNLSEQTIRPYENGSSFGHSFNPGPT